MVYNTEKMDKDKELSKIAGEIRKCRLCKQWGTGMPVPGEGSADARLVFIGEAPGKEEAKTGRPFVGRSGRLLRLMISEIGLKAEEVYITSPVKYLPLRGTPSRENILHSREHLMKQLSIIGPQTVVLLGSVACLALLDRKVEITKTHGTSVRKDGRTYFITYHPAYALRFPKGKEGLREDLGKLARNIMKTSPR
ncbi:MAG: uracil-DNA glycosylase [Acidobacteriota bacterium]